MDSRNIIYSTKNLVDYFSKNRRKWDEFYESERVVIDEVIRKQDAGFRIMDVGCACGGLGVALSERYKNIAYYCGVDINEEMICYARKNDEMTIPHDFIAGDIALLENEELYDVVISLSCIDWNVETEKMLNACWSKLKKGGYLILSLRLTNMDTVNDITKGYQYIAFDSKVEEGDQIANYVVYNWKDILKKFQGMEPSVDFIRTYGYWGKPSETAVIPYDKLCFMVFGIRKSEDEVRRQTLDLCYRGPVDLLI